MARAAVIFDLDGVLTDTAQLHYRSWREVADGLGLPFGRDDYERMRGLGRMESLAVVLAEQDDRFSEDEKQRLADQKNEAYMQLVAQMTPQDAFPGVVELMAALHARGIPLAVASSSRNAAPVLDRLALRPWLTEVVDANIAPRSKPDPQVFLVTAERLGVSPAHCVVLEDARAGVAAALAAGMRVIGIGPAARVGAAHLVVDAIGDLDADAVLRLVTPSP